MSSGALVVLGVTFATQLLFTRSDFLARQNMRTLGFTFAAFTSPWLREYFAVRLPAVCGQLFVYSREPLSIGSLLFSAASILITPAVGIIFLKERLTVSMTIGTCCILAGLYFITRPN